MVSRIKGNEYRSLSWIYLYVCCSFQVICKEKNAELARTDPIRPFISGHVANSMAAEVIALLHSLLSARETLAAHTWANAVEKVRKSENDTSEAGVGLPYIWSGSHDPSVSLNPGQI